MLSIFKHILLMVLQDGMLPVLRTPSTSSLRTVLTNSHGSCAPLTYACNTGLIPLQLPSTRTKCSPSFADLIHRYISYGLTTREYLYKFRTNWEAWERILFFFKSVSGVDHFINLLLQEKCLGWTTSMHSPG